VSKVCELVTDKALENPKRPSDLLARFLERDEGLTEVSLPALLANRSDGESVPPEGPCLNGEIVKGVTDRC
jgi:hypothetical protein